MEACTLRALNVTATSSPRARFAERSFFYGQTLRLPNAKKCPFARRVKFLEFRAPSTAKFRVSPIEASSKGINPKEEDLAFVAGATGKVGSRAVRELLKLGFRVRAGVRSAKKAEGLVQSVKQMKLDGDKDGVQPVEKLELVECDLEKPNQILPALGNASVVLSCIGASEKEIFDVTGPYRIDYLAAKNLIDAATSAKVNHFIMVSSLGTNKFGFPAAILNLFWGVLCWKRRSEEALIASGIPYTIVRPGGMERPTDAYKLTHNITLSEEDKLFGGQVSTLQVAELMAVMAKNRSLSYCKVVEVIAETTAPLTPTEQLLAKIPSQRAEPPKLEVSDAVVSSVSSPATAALSEPQSTVIDKATTITEPIATPASVSSEPPSTPIDKETTITEPPATRPLSPYAAYEDLKPPASPSPLPPITQKQSEEVSPPDSEVAASSVSDTTTTEEITPSIDPTEAKSIEVVKPQPQPLSPYTAYDDLKPPSSPSPVPSGPKEVISGPAVIEETSGPLVIEEPVEEPVTTEEIIPSIDTTEAKSAEVFKPQPLSPYTAYDDLKPPSSPSPVPSGPKEVTSGPAVIEETSGPLVTEEPVEEPVTTEEITPTIDTTEAKSAKVVKPQPLSPYTAYDDLKPPSSPSPVSSGPKQVISGPAVTEETSGPLVTEEPVEEPVTTEEITPSIDTTEAESAEVVKPQPLSPYTAYDDLKPPSSPSPVSSGPKEVTSGPAVTEETSGPLVVTEEPVEEPEVGGNGVAVLDDDVKEDPPKDSPSYRSPYFVYDDFKPPTTPSPSSPPPPPPSSASEPPSDSNGAAKLLEEAVAPPPTDEPSITADTKKPTPLSPYAMYEDLKPPTSPTPFPSSS